MNTHTRGLDLALAFLILTVPFMTPVMDAAQSPKDSAEVSGLLAEAKTEAVQLKNDAEEMKLFVRSKRNWQSHAAKLDQIKQHVNKLGDLLAKMNNAKATASPRQQELIDRVAPLLRDMAISVTATIKHLSENKDRLLHPPYPAYAAANADYAADISQLVSDDVAYGEAKQKAEDLTQEIEAPAH